MAIIVINSKVSFFHGMIDQECKGKAYSTIKPLKYLEVTFKEVYGGIPKKDLEAVNSMEESIALEKESRMPTLKEK